MSFTKKLNKSAPSALSLIIVPERPGQTAWYFIDMDPLKLTRFRKDVFSGPVNLEAYGNVIKRGYGEYPPQKVIDEMIREYGYQPK